MTPDATISPLYFDNQNATVGGRFFSRPLDICNNGKVFESTTFPRAFAQPAILRPTYFQINGPIAGEFALIHPKWEILPATEFPSGNRLGIRISILTHFCICFLTANR